MRGPLAVALVWAVAAEFLLVRLLSRVGVFIPKSGTFLAVYRGMVLTGEVAFNLSLGLAVLVLALALSQGRSGWAWLVGAAGLMALVGPALPGGALLAAGSIPLAVAALGRRALGRVELPERMGLGLILLAQLLRYATAGLQLGWMSLALPGELPGAAWLLRAGELAAALAPIALAVAALRLPARLGAPRLLSVGASALLLLGLWANADLTGVLAMFALGFTLSWPPVLYVLAAGAAIYALGAWRGEGRLALCLLFLAGLGLNVNQQQLVVMAGWALLALPVPLDGEEGS